jgi:hypothetical protein
LHGMQEVGGSIPPGSTIFLKICSNENGPPSAGHSCFRRRTD